MRKEYQEILNHSYSFFTCNVTWGGNNRNFYPSFISLFYWVTIFLKSCIYISYSQHTIPRLPKSIFESQLGILDEFPNLTLHVMTSTFHTTHIRIFFFCLLGTFQGHSPLDCIRFTSLRTSWFVIYDHIQFCVRLLFEILFIEIYFDLIIFFLLPSSAKRLHSFDIAISWSAWLLRLLYLLSTSNITFTFLKIKSPLHW